MIIKRLKNYFTVSLQREDWWYASTYTLLGLLKSIPKEYRKYDPTNKIWLVAYSYEHLLEKVQVFTQEEESTGQLAYENFMNLTAKP